MTPGGYKKGLVNYIPTFSLFLQPYPDESVKKNNQSPCVFSYKYNNFVKKTKNGTKNIF